MKRIMINNTRFGGFCASNSGSISNSYSLAHISKIKYSGSFCFKNNGKINNCFSRDLIRKNKINNFFYENNGIISNSFSDLKTDSDSNNINENSEVVFCNFGDLTVSELKEHYNFNFNAFWRSPKDSDTLLALELKNKLYEASQIANLENLQPIAIDSAQDLFSISDKIRNGDRDAAAAYYVLTKDIDLKGKRWIPLGNIICPFTGIFDGCGHKILNFKVLNKELTFAGFFGVIENAVVLNLQVDCMIKAGAYAGGFVGLNKNGKIYSCSAVAQVMGQKYAGGFVGHNTGIIEGCFYTGKIKKFFPIFWLFAIPIASFAALGTLYLLNPMKNTSTFNNVPIDPYSSKSSDSSVYRGEGNKASFKFSDIVRFHNGEADFSFGNPDSTNQSMTIKIQITDEVLMNKIGKTGRTQDEQKQLDNDENYDPSNARVTVSESGLILPGYDLKKLILNKLPDGTTLPKGVYSGIAYLNFFNYETNEKAMINSQIPIAVVVE